MRSRVAVLGAGGFIASRIVEMLHLGNVAEVRPVARTAAGLGRASRFALDARVADAFDAGALRRAFDGVDVVVHAIAGDRRTILGTLGPTYAAASAAGVRRLVYLSSASVHGQAPAAGTTEDTPLHARHSIPYNNAKVLAEWKLARLRERGHVELVVLRPAIVFGPRSTWTGGLADELLAGQAYLVDGGAGICNSIYVDNLVDAITRAMTAPGVDGHAFLVGDRETVTWAEFVRPIAEALGLDLADVPVVSFEARPRSWLKLVMAACRRNGRASSPWVRPSPPVVTVVEEKALLHRCPSKLSSAKAARMLGYEPRVTFAEGCRRSLAWLAFAGYPVGART